MRNVSQMMAAPSWASRCARWGLGAVGEPAVAHLIERPMAALGVPEGAAPDRLVIAPVDRDRLHMVLGEMVPKNITSPARPAPRWCSARAGRRSPAARTGDRCSTPWPTLRSAVRRPATDEVAASFDERRDPLDGHPVAPRGPARQRGRRAGRGR
jgi:hypothetical protein